MSTLDLDKLAAAKLWLVSAPRPGTPTGRTITDTPRDLPYLAHALYALVPLPCPDIPTMTVDERWRISVNPHWLATATVPEVGAQLAHAVWHVLSDHAGRARDLDVDRSTATAWDRAADVALRPTLGADRVVPDEFPEPADIPALPGRSAEEYYAMLTGLPATAADDGDPGDAGGPGGPGDATSPELGGCGSGADGIPRGHELGPDLDVGEVDRLAAREIRRLVAIEYREHGQRRGDTPGDALRWVRSILEPTVPWEPLLSGAVRRAVGWAAGRGDATYSRPSRRSSSVPQVVLPGWHRPVPRVALVVDTSGSVDDGLLARALGEVDGVIGALGLPGSSVTVYSVDAAVHTAQPVRRARDARLVGAGGTDLRVGLRAVEAQRPRPDVVVVFTDGGTPWPSTPPPGSAVIVALLSRAGEQPPPTPPWAIRVDCVLD